MKPGRPERAAVSRPDVKKDTRGEKTHTAHDEGRHCLDRISDCEVRRAPDDIDRREGSDNLRARGALFSHSAMKMGGRAVEMTENLIDRFVLSLALGARPPLLSL